ncbi:acyl-CoA dehydrogenase family protein [Aquabacterium sp. OR-4]|uniref:acyl-CoA dehydrogenase family protein n=1 Tax=Aquabacterium sp. OR-4 TaxID=2978127 RepID=UPI0021B3362F|nr:acyl-CoA dehydrogenase family protein [Aquabacterium sp. OR-4]MDT7835566.1 acyl-CoA dehydrogenase family protein [Aquabacterium sp. OR-4]
MPIAALDTPAHAALMAQAEAAATLLAGRSAAIEAQRALPADLANALAEAGLYRLLTPAAYGGHEAPPASFWCVIERLARADAAAAWCSFIACTSSLLAAWLPADEAAAVFGRPALKAAGVFAPRGRALPATQAGRAGWRVSGRWAWGSGTANADVISVGCLVDGADGRPQTLPDGTPRVLSLLLDRAQVHLLDNWQAVGLCGTGSGEFEVSEAFVPAARAASLFDAPVLATPLTRFPLFGLLAIAIAAVAAGIAGSALAHFADSAAHGVPQAGTRPLASRATVQEAFARSSAQLHSARAWLLATVDEAWAAAQQPGALPLASRRDLRLAATHLTHTAAEVVGRVYSLAGGAAVFGTSPLQRALRDVHVATQHMMVGESTWELTGRLLLDQPTQTSLL